MLGAGDDDPAQRLRPGHRARSLLCVGANRAAPDNYVKRRRGNCGTANMPAANTGTVTSLYPAAYAGTPPSERDAQATDGTKPNASREAPMYRPTTGVLLRVVSDSRLADAVRGRSGS